MQERQRLLEKVKQLDKQIETRAIIFTSLLKGILISDNKKSTPTNKQTQTLIQGGENMKYRGITIHKNKNCNTWYTRYTNNGKQVYLSSKTQQECYNKLKIALRKQEQTEIKQLKQKNEDTKTITLIEWFNKWVDLYKQKVKDNTKRDYYKSMKYLTALHNKKINNIKSIEILEILNTIEKERRKQMVYDLLKALFDKAILNEFITKNPMLVIEKPKHKKINGEALTNEDEQIFENICIDNQYDMFLLCLYQGLRRGEILALTIDDIDFKNKTLTINKAINDSNELDTTKNSYSNRIIPLFDKTLKVLEKYKSLPSQTRLFNLSYYGIDKKLKRIINKHFPNKKYTLHSLRHTFVTKCQEANIPLHIIQSWVGHNIGSDVTNKVYTHKRNNAELENIEKFNVYMG